MIGLKSLFRSGAARRDSLESAARAAESEGDFGRAAAARRELADREPRSAEAWLSLAGVLKKADEPRDSIAAYRKALECGASAGKVHLQLGVLHMTIGDYPLAQEHFEKVPVDEPDHADALCMLGVLMNDLKRFDDAARYLERAIERNPAFSEAHFNLGLAHFERSDFHGASRSFTRCVELRRGSPWCGDRSALLRRDPAPGFEPMDMGVNEIKLRHDCEQLEYLLNLGRLPPAFREVLDDYRSLLDEIRGRVDASSVIPFDPARHRLVARTYKRPIHISGEPPPSGPLINPDVDFRDTEDRYLSAKPNLASFDAILTPQALEALRRFCRESTIWNNIKAGYLGAYFFDGFCSEMLLRLAWELRERLPRVIRGLPLQMMWGYKCDSSLPGLGVHSDAAAVNVNFWITEDEANLDPERGGLLVYTHDAPKDWGFMKFNNASATILQYLESVGSIPVRVPYRANRAVIFDSDLFHATDDPHFREGYLNRRINITILYGIRPM